MELETFLATTWWIFALELFLGALTAFAYHLFFRRLAMYTAVLAVALMIVTSIRAADGLFVFSVALVCVVLGYCVGHSYGIVKFPR